MMTRLLTVFYRWYTTRAPGHKGKGRVVQWLGQRLERGSFVARMDDGFCLHIRPGDWVSREMFFERVWEADNAAVVKRILRSGDTFVDVGANLGYFALLAAPLVGSTGKVFAYEPMPATYDWLASNIALNQTLNIEAYQSALSDKPGTLVLNLFVADSAATASQFQAWRDDPQMTVSVAAHTLDEHLLPKLQPVTEGLLLKIDAEGGELAILRGGQTLLDDRRPAIMIELFPALDAAAGWEPQELLDMLAARGYEFYVPAGSGTVRPLDVSADLPSSTKDAHIDIFAFRKDVPWHGERLALLLRPSDARNG